MQRNAAGFPVFLRYLEAVSRFINICFIISASLIVICGLSGPANKMFAAVIRDCCKVRQDQIIAGHSIQCKTIRPGSDYLMTVFIYNSSIISLKYHFNKFLPDCIKRQIHIRSKRISGKIVHILTSKRSFLRRFRRRPAKEKHSLLNRVISGKFRDSKRLRPGYRL